MSSFYSNSYPNQARRQLTDETVHPDSARWFWALILLHLPLVLLMRQYEMVSTIHALAVSLAGLFYLVHDEKPDRIVYLCAYISGAEVLWRMTNAEVFWEFGKLVIIFFFFMGTLKWGQGKFGFLPLAFILPLLISSPLTLRSLSLSDARQQLSFNLFGPVLLAIGLAFFGNIQLERRQVEKMLRSLVLPIAGISFLVIYTIQTAESIKFFTESNFTTSGGYGPNQVSAVLGLGAVACWLLTLTLPIFNLDRTFLLGLSAIFILQAIFTFSRGGVFNVLLAAPFATLWIMRSSSRTFKVAFVGVILISAIATYTLPQLNETTGGLLEQRYQELDTTNRLDISILDFEIWKDHWLTGVGPGMSVYYRAPILGKFVAPHTEYSRLLAEHGVFGIWTIILMGGMLLYAFVKAPTPWAKGMVLACMLWSLLEMSHAAMRIAVISYWFTLPFALLKKSD